MRLNHSPGLLLPITGALALATLLGVSACSTETSTAPTTPPSNSETSSRTDAVGEPETVHRDGHDLATYLTAGTTGTIVLDAGGGHDASYWNDIVPALVEQTGAAIVTYDRSGVGKSEEVPGAFDPSAAGEDLAAIIESLDIPDGPVVLVGHSIAGEVAHALVTTAPDLIDGAVLVDANLPPFFTPEQIARLLEVNAAYVEELRAGPSTPESRQFLAAAENWGPVHTAFHAMTWPQSIPVTVIVSDETPFPAGTEEVTNWRNAAEEFVAQANNRSLVTAKGTSHDVPLDDPELVQEQIENMFRGL